MAGSFVGFDELIQSTKFMLRKTEFEAAPSLGSLHAVFSRTGAGEQ